MNMMYIPALAGFGGSAFGAVSTIMTNWAAQRRMRMQSSATSPKFRSWSTCML